MKNLDAFECQRCNECCRQPGYVYISEGEASSMAGFLGQEIYSFMNQYCDLLDRRQLALKKLEGEVCIFLKENGCAVHSVKPEQCRDFPIRWRTLKSLSYCEGLKQLQIENDRANI